MTEFYIRDHALISDDEWDSEINSYKPDSESIESEESIKKIVNALFEEALKKRLTDEPIGIMFSGGLDSSYIAAVCKKLKIKFKCYTVGFQDGNFKEPEDVAHARNVAQQLGLSADEFKVKIFNAEEMKDIFRKTIEILRKAEQHHKKEINNVVNVGVGAVEVAVHSIARGEKVFFSGLGSEEIFAGYDRHKKNPTNDECFQGLLRMYGRDILRDDAISEASGFRFITPFLDEELIKYALSIPIGLKINAYGSKMILREAARPLLGALADRPKRAAQYGSSFDKALSKLASEKGYKYKKDYITD